MNEQDNLKPSLEDLFKDFLHPNPNINERAFADMVKHWPDDSLNFLFGNLQKNDTDIRRKSIKALGFFGELVYAPLIALFMQTDKNIIQTSCIKVLVKVSAAEEFTSFPDEVIKIIELALEKDSPEMILTVVPLLRQIGAQGLPYLLEICNCNDNNLLRISTAIIALGEIKDIKAEQCLESIIQDPKRDEFVRKGAIRALKS